MNKDEEILFEDLDDKIVSSDEYEKELPEEGVPSNSNRTKLNKKKNDKSQSNNQLLESNINNFKLNQDFEKNNKNTINRLNDINAKNQGFNNNFFNQIGNNSDKDEIGKEVVKNETNNIEGKTAKNAATNVAGNVAKNSIAKVGKEIATKQAVKTVGSTFFKKYLIIGGVIAAFIFLIFIIILVSNEDDIQDSGSDQLNLYINGNMTDEELEQYLKYIGVCTDAVDNYNLSEEQEKKINVADCKYAKQYFKKIKEINEKYKEPCSVGLTKEKDINNPCAVELNSSLLHETLSYTKSNDELWNKKTTPNQEKSIEELSSAMVEYVHESCYQMVKLYKDKNGNISENYTEGSTSAGEKKVDRDWYYFQISFSKYISFLKYGYTSSHPFYSFGSIETNIGTYSVFPIWKAENIKETTIQFGENHDHECVGPMNSEFDYSTINLNINSSSSSSSSSKSVSVTDSNYCSNKCSSAKQQGIPSYDACVSSCEKKKNSCDSNNCNAVKKYDTSSYVSCMKSCVK